MDIVKATLYFIVLEFITIFSWFAIVVHIKDVINFMVSAVHISQVTVIGQNVVWGLNVVWLFMAGCWVAWYFYMIHALTYQTTFQNLPVNKVRRW